MTGRDRHGDDARALPQGEDPAPADDGDGDVYVVDVRGRRRDRSAGPSRAAGPAPSTSRPHAARPPQPGASAPDVSAPAGPRRTDPPPDRPRPRRRRRGLRWVLVVVLVVLAWLAFMVFTPLHAWNSVSRVDASPSGARPAQGKGVNYLLVGSDSRGGLTKEQRKEYSTGRAPGQRTDSIILVHVPSSGGKPVLLSIPRDSYVPIPGHGSNKINASFSIGGPRLLVATVEQVTGLRIDGYVEIGFGGFAGVVDSLGGVRICVPFRMNDPKAGIDLQKGCQVLDGRNALGYVRARYSDPRGDIGRAERQRQFLAAVMKKAATPSTVLVPTRYWGFSHAVAGGLIIGDETSLRDATRVLLALRAVSNDQGLSLVVPIADLNYQTRAGSSVKWDTQRAKALFRDLREDVPLEAPPPGTNGKPSGG